MRNKNYKVNSGFGAEWLQTLYISSDLKDSIERGFPKFNQNHINYFPGEDSFTIYYQREDNILGSYLEKLPVPNIYLDKWRQFIEKIDGSIPTEKELEDFLESIIVNHD